MLVFSYKMVNIQDVYVYKNNIRHRHSIVRHFWFHSHLDWSVRNRSTMITLILFGVYRHFKQCFTRTITNEYFLGKKVRTDITNWAVKRRSLDKWLWTYTTWNVLRFKVCWQKSMTLSNLPTLGNNPVIIIDKAVVTIYMPCVPVSMKYILFPVSVSSIIL